MTGEHDQLVHLAGYASIVAVLATADWAGLTARILALPIVLGALYYGGLLLIRRVTAQRRRDLEDQHGPREATAAADGGQELGRRTTGSDRNRSENE